MFIHTCSIPTDPHVSDDHDRGRPQGTCVHGQPSGYLDVRLDRVSDMIVRRRDQLHASTLHCTAPSRHGWWHSIKVQNSITSVHVWYYPTTVAKQNTKQIKHTKHLKRTRTHARPTNMKQYEARMLMMYNSDTSLCISRWSSIITADFYTMSWSIHWLTFIDGVASDQVLSHSCYIYIGVANYKCDVISSETTSIAFVLVWITSP